MIPVADAQTLGTAAHTRAAKSAQADFANSSGEFIRSSGRTARCRIGIATSINPPDTARWAGSVLDDRRRNGRR
jgi:hypothetical protein